MSNFMLQPESQHALQQPRQEEQQGMERKTRFIDKMFLWQQQRKSQFSGDASNDEHEIHEHDVRSFPTWPPSNATMTLQPTKSLPRLDSKMSNLAEEGRFSNQQSESAYMLNSIRLGLDDSSSGVGTFRDSIEKALRTHSEFSFGEGTTSPSSFLLATTSSEENDPGQTQLYLETHAATVQSSTHLSVQTKKPLPKNPAYLLTHSDVSSDSLSSESDLRDEMVTPSLALPSLTMADVQTPASSHHASSPAITITPPQQNNRLSILPMPTAFAATNIIATPDGSPALAIDMISLDQPRSPEFSVLSPIERPRSLALETPRIAGSPIDDTVDMDMLTPEVSPAQTPILSVSPSSPSSTAVSGAEDLNSKLLSTLWVPASLHPTLNPTEFRDFLAANSEALLDNHLGEALFTPPTQRVKRSSSFRERHMSITPDNIQELENINDATTLNRSFSTNGGVGGSIRRRRVNKRTRGSIGGMDKRMSWDLSVTADDVVVAESLELSTPTELTEIEANALEMSVAVEEKVEVSSIMSEDETKQELDTTFSNIRTSLELMETESVSVSEPTSEEHKKWFWPFGKKSRSKSSKRSESRKDRKNKERRDSIHSSDSEESQSPTSSIAPRPLPARYGIGVERSLYRLSHAKLSHASRSLCQQVTISNLMIHYLALSATNGMDGLDEREKQREQERIEEQIRQVKKRNVRRLMQSKEGGKRAERVNEANPAITKELPVGRVIRAEVGELKRRVRPAPIASNMSLNQSSPNLTTYDGAAQNDDDDDVPLGMLQGRISTSSAPEVMQTTYKVIPKKPLIQLFDNVPSNETTSDDNVNGVVNGDVKMNLGFDVDFGGNNDENFQLRTQVLEDLKHLDSDLNTMKQQVVGH